MRVRGKVMVMMLILREMLVSVASVVNCWVGSAQLWLALFLLG